MHIQQIQFIQSLIEKYPRYKSNVKILDIGSADSNGNNKQFFDLETSDYVGIDIHEYKNVDIISKAHEFKSRYKYDVVISGEMLEHDQHWRLSLQNMAKLTKKGGILIITCASTGRPEHGTNKTSPQDSPATTDYYYNISTEEFNFILQPEVFFADWETTYNQESCDLYFYGIKK